MVNEEFSENDASETLEEEPKVHYDVFYRCLAARAAHMHQKKLLN